MKKNTLFLFSSWFMGVLFALFAISMAVATFIENDFGSIVAQKWVYGAKWFELILFLLVVNLIGQIFEKQLFNRKKLTILLFHLSFVLIIIGAGITRYFGFDGSMHIRQGSTQNICTSTEKYVHLTIKDESNKKVFENENRLDITSKSVDNYSKTVSLNNKDYSIKLVEFIPNAIETIADSKEGEPLIGIMINYGFMIRQSKILKQGDIQNINGVNVGFSSNDSIPIRLIFEKDSFYILSNEDLMVTNMMSQQKSIVKKGNKSLIKHMEVFNIKGKGLVIQKFSSSGEIKLVSHKINSNEQSRNVLKFEVKTGSLSKNVNLWIEDEMETSNESIQLEDKTLELSYGPRKIMLPFGIKLNKFILDRYPGSNSPSSYKSDVTLIDYVHKIEKPYSIYMNHILKYKGYRFYQSSYDKDERGTILSVNQDRVGMLVTYLGYILLFLFIILSIFNKNSLLRTITINAWNNSMKKVGITILAIFISSTALFGNDQKVVVDKRVADNFGKVLVQDQKGRTKPLFTLSNDIIRKVTKKNQFEDYSSMQVFLGFYSDFNSWKDVKLIKVSNGDLAKKLEISGDYAAFTDIVDLETNNYKLGKLVEEAYSKPDGSRNKLDKEVIKLDERINILYMIYTGEFFKIFPLNNKTSNWGSPYEAIKYAQSKEDSLYLKNIMNLIIESSQKASISRNYKEVDEFVNSISDYQRKFSTYPLPSKSKVNIEISYNKTKIFEKLFPYYATLGLILVITLIISIVSGRENKPKLIKYLNILLIVGFVFHTLGLALRWYISGHAPLSNGYESMVFISWATLLAGFIFSKKSNFSIPATAVLSSLTLLVAHLSFMDPEITNLVPVLKSYWLTLHVSVIISSYGFLGLGAILGLIVLILYSLSSPRNRERISKAVDELTVLNYSTLTIGLYLLTIGTFLGAIWANESWGRYWGWDPKETWSLITLIIYSIVIHSRMIKSLRSIFVFNILSLFAFSSVLMTYFGVNYYLSGLHSYASGDPIPVPSFVYITVIALILLSVFASIKYKKFETNDK